MILNSRDKPAFTFSLLAGLIFCNSMLFSQPASTSADWQSPHALQQLQAAPVALIPFPQQVEWSNQTCLLKANATVCYFISDTAGVANALRSLAEILGNRNIAVKQLPVKANDILLLDNAILLLINKDIHVKSEGYTLDVNNKGVVVTGKDAAGLYYGVQTLRQLVIEKKGKLLLPGCHIEDWPAFGLRGFMHDNGRNFQEIASLKKQLDRLSAYKFNTFHWHLTDNPAWRPQSNLYPQLNDAKNRKAGRDPERSYSFDEIRELIRYAREHVITVIPELDMPGHSAYFEPTFGFKMGSEQGMQVLEKLIDEFCSEIPATDCPIIHLGSDEVHINNPQAFIRRMTARVKANGRKAMVWNPGLPPEQGTIEQVWRDDATNGNLRGDGNPYVDAYAGYLNSYDALSLIQRYFFQQVCNKQQGDSLALGGILCCWPDTRVDDKRKILLYNPVWPGALTYSEAVWCGRPQAAEKYMSALPTVTATAGKYFHEFEMRLASHRDRFFTNEPFPYVQFGNIAWQMTGPYDRNKMEPVGNSATVNNREVTGGVIRLEGWLDRKIILSGNANETVYLTAYMKSDKARTVHAMTGFEAPVRSNRRSAGIPANGKWDANGGALFVNGKEVPGPQWQNPGGNRYLKPTWETPANEIPYTDEEFYWSRPPAVIELKKGWNKIVARVPRTYQEQAWMFAFIPVKLNAQGRWVEDGSVTLQASAGKAYHQL